jgi:hypothetical protein
MYLLVARKVSLANKEQPGNFLTNMERAPVLSILIGASFMPIYDDRNLHERITPRDHQSWSKSDAWHDSLVDAIRSS